MNALNQAVTPVARQDLTLKDVLLAVEQRTDILEENMREYRSALVRTGKLLKEDLGQLRLDLMALSERLDAINPVAAGISPKRLSNIRWALLRAVAASCLVPGVMASHLKKPELTESWKELRARLSRPRHWIGVGRLAHACSRHGIPPSEVDDTVLGNFVAEAQATSLSRQLKKLHRQAALVWNEIAAELPDLALRTVTIPPSRRKSTRIEWSELPQGFRDDSEAYLTKLANPNIFADDYKPFAPSSIRRFRNNISAACTALIKSGTDPAAIRTLADLVTPAAFEAILGYRHAAVGGRENHYNVGLAQILLHAARYWVKLDKDTIDNLKRKVRRLPKDSLQRMTAKNEGVLRQFDDVAVLRRYFALPAQLWREVKAEENPTWMTFAKAQAAIAAGILTYMPIRLQNLARLAFDKHIFLQSDTHSISTLVIPAEEVKNKRPIKFVIPQVIVGMLLEYRDRIAPRILGHSTKLIFVKRRGEPKGHEGLRYLIKAYMGHHVGVYFTPHNFRHLAGQLILDRNPGAHEQVKQLLNHGRLETTVNHYAGINTKRAGLYHQELLEKTIAELSSPRRRKKRSR